MQGFFFPSSLKEVKPSDISIFLKTQKRNSTFLRFLKCAHCMRELAPDLNVGLVLLGAEEVTEQEITSMPTTAPVIVSSFLVAAIPLYWVTPHVPAMSLCSIETRSTCSFIKFSPNIAPSIPEGCEGAWSVTEKSLRSLGGCHGNRQIRRELRTCRLN